MSIRFVRLCFLLTCCFSTVAQATLSADHVQLGEQRPGRRVNADALIENDSATSVTILRDVHAVGSKVRASGLPLTVPANGTAKLHLDVQVDRQLGSQAYYAELALDGEQGNLRVVVNLFVDSAIDGEPKSVDFGIVPAGKAASRRVDLASRDLPDLRARSAKDKDGILDAETVDGGRGVVLHTRADAPWGMHKGWVEIETTSQDQPTTWIKYSVETRGRVVPETYAVDAGVQHAGEVQSNSLFIRDTGGAALALGKITQRGAPVITKVTDCPMKEVSCRALELRLDDSKVKDGRFSSALTVDLPHYNQKLTISYFGRIFPPGTNVVNLNELAAAQASNESGDANLEAALKTAIQPEPVSLAMPVPDGQGPLLQWDVENEQRIYGYIVFRADSESGPLRRLNENIIRTRSGKDNIPVKYYWRDASALVGHTYWYQIGTVDQYDVRADLTPRIRKAYEGGAVKGK
jgi:hypothetical protein